MSATPDTTSSESDLRHSDRIRWFEAAYDRLRATHVPEAPPGVVLTIGFCSSKRQGGDMRVGETHFECFEGGGIAFGSDTIITLHPIQGNDLVGMLGTLAHEMVHAGLPPEAKHGKPFIAIAKRIGLQKPWPKTTPDGRLAQDLGDLMMDLKSDLGFIPEGHYVPKPPTPKKPTQSRKIRCGCQKPTILTVTQHQVEKGNLGCMLCHEPFRIIKTPGAIEEESGLVQMG